MNFDDIKKKFFGKNNVNKIEQNEININGEESFLVSLLYAFILAIIIRSLLF